MQSFSAAAEIDATDMAHHTRGRSAASWGAIFAGAAVALATSLILVSLGAGLEFASVSPWYGRGASAPTFGVTTAIWFIVTQWLSAGLGGYITGRLRTRWIGTHQHEVFFRDTAHGLVMWSLATVVFVAVMAGSVTSVLGAAGRAADQVVGVNQGGIGASPADAYAVDKLFRSAGPAIADGSAPRGLRIDAAHIVSNAVSSGALPDPDRAYLASLIGQETGVPAKDARQRVDELVRSLNETKSRVQQAADAARKAAAETAVYTALSMLIGAFIASVAAAFAGRLRDQHN